MTRSTKAFCAEEALEKIEKALGILEERGTCADVEEVLDKIEDALKARREEKGIEQDNENPSNDSCVRWECPRSASFANFRLDIREDVD